MRLKFDQLCLIIEVAVSAIEKKNFERVLRPALDRFIGTLKARPELLSTQAGVDALQGHLGLDVGDVPDESHIKHEIQRFNDLVYDVYPDSPEQRQELAQRWADSYDDYYINALEHQTSKLSKRPQHVPPEGKTWGKYLFSPAREDVPFESNTSDEQKAYKAIWKMLFRNEPLPDDVARTLQSLNAVGEYSVLLEPQQRKFYRGMVNVSSEVISQLIGWVPVDDGSVRVNTTYTPLGTGSSWSIRKDVAVGYATSGAMGKHTTKKGNWSVVLSASKTQNQNVFILNPMTLYDIGNFSGSESQDNASSAEVYAIGPVKLSHVSWWRSEQAQC